MWTRLFLFLLLITGIALADAGEDYDRMKDEIREQRRLLNEAHSRRDYVEASRLQKKVKKMLDEAIKVGRQAPNIGRATLWNHYASNLKDIGYPQQALQAVESYLHTPLLDRNGFRHGWKKKAEIYKRLGDYRKAQRAFGRALSFTDKPRDKFSLRRDLVNLSLRNMDLGACEKQLGKLDALLTDLQPERMLKAQYDLESLRGRVFRRFEKTEEARVSKQKELRLKKQILEQEIQTFDAHYPIYEHSGNILTKRP